MATLNYITLKYPQNSLALGLQLIQALPYFNVYKHKYQPGIIFRIPHGLNDGDVCHFFIEHEVNMTNTIKTGTLTMKVQISVIPCHMGLFSGFEHLEGSYKTDWYDEEGYGEDRFVPNYQSADNVKKIVPLPVNIKSNLYEYLNEILFSKVEDADIVQKYAVHLGCQKNVIKERVVYVPVPDNNSDGKRALVAHKQTTHLFESIRTEGAISLIPEQKQLTLPT